ncbi:MAG: hypothetical protein ACI9NT_002217, partial [Bacteroidia bacterium]
KHRSHFSARQYPPLQARKTRAYALGFSMIYWGGKVLTLIISHQPYSPEFLISLRQARLQSPCDLCSIR